ncbi:MAG: glycine cleavage system protein GcvH [Acidimicrobiales bacterium]|nr:glycine cleavage system protein GcvH [Acidimicrobiales bacterium]
MLVPEDMRFTTEHEWMKWEGSNLRMGITDYAQDALGDVVYVSLPSADARYESGGTLGEVESTKSVSEIYAPVNGMVISINDRLSENPELINEDPYGDGWICLIAPDDIEGYEELLERDDYITLTHDETPRAF